VVGRIRFALERFASPHHSSHVAQLFSLGILNNMKNKLLWLLAAVIVFDFGITLVGQPASYWHHPHTAEEGNPIFRWFMIRGIICYLAFILGYTSGVVAMVSRLPRPAAIITGLAFLFSHYFAGSTWLDFHFHLNMVGPAIYALVLAVAFLLVFQSGDWKACFGEDKS
jgi:hypothetical protein